MMSGPAYNAKVTRQDGKLSQLLKKGASDEEILDEFYVAALNNSGARYFPGKPRSAQISANFAY